MQDFVHPQYVSSRSAWLKSRLASACFAVWKNRSRPNYCLWLGMPSCKRRAIETRSPVVPFYVFWGEGSPTKIDYRKKGSLSLASLLEDLGEKNLAFALGTC